MRAQRGIVVIEHESGCPLDRFADWLDVDAHVIRPYAGDSVPTRVDDGLLVLGGAMSAYDDVVAPWLPAVRGLLATAVSERVPTLGICLGAQLLAVATGGRVEVADRRGREAGIVDVRWRHPATADPLVLELPEPFAGPSMHADAVVALPDEAVWLAETAMYPHQAFRIGPAAWGVQFHPEVSLPTYRRWAERSSDVDTEAVTDDYRARVDEVAEAGRQLARRFGAVVTAPSPAT
ncbi:MAG TPA: type 1 glutamine amidotransferase [Nocardioidaceae bacterium]|nr:type 1 glutamine amidotransferase [Nocardioidaceae bacterium]